MIKMGDDVEKVCKKCGSCCRFGSGFVLAEEVDSIARSLGIPKKRFKDEYLQETEMFNTRTFKFKIKKKGIMPFGPCIFYKDNLCTIHNFKPQHCRIGNCSDAGDEDHARFIINQFVNTDDPESIRQYHAYIKTGGLVPKGLELEALVPKQRLRDILDFKIIR